MHELGICDAILKTVDGIAKEEQLTAVYKVTLEVGMLSGVVPRFLTDCWQAVIDGTPYQDTALAIETINGLARCEDCGHEFSADLERLETLNAIRAELAAMGVTLTDTPEEEAPAEEPAEAETQQAAATDNRPAAETGGTPFLNLKGEPQTVTIDLDGPYTEVFTGQKYGKGKQEFLLWPGSYVVLTK